ncbi:hypothetical protein [Flavisolibacter ginsenosidimutans]|uniref:Lipoprotein n=1 Tax=Flavisolibacter ginsenosidimutans TaxID=661481 RepID=A0A5B8UEV0_9BACT|nr:hypothetical protein [Flavisolibacter ginsenosidimutans]QEC54659.1 hypothetical protein FSB75_01670 [Flavisolibacter ginsenosidimutans]
MPVRFTLLCFLFAISCKSKLLDDEQYHSQVLVDTTRRAVLYAEDSRAKGNRKEPFLTNLSRLMSLPAINKGTSEEYIRIWFWNLPSPDFVVGIRKQGSQGSLEVCSFGSSANGDSVIIYSKRLGVLPKSGWVAFADSLRQLGVSNMPGYNEELKKKGSVACHGAFVNFEVSSQDAYRYYEYLDPYFYRFVDSNSSRIDQFLLYLNRELNLQVYQPASKLFLEP